jgi:dihydrofolate reductase
MAVQIASTGNDSGEIAVIGGAAIYELFWPLAHRIELTQIQTDYSGDTFMKAPGADWELAAQQHHAGDGVNPAFSFQTYHRRTKVHN